MFYYLSQYLLDWSAGTPGTNGVVRVAAVSLHHLSQRGRGGDGPAVELVVRAASDCLAEGIEVSARITRTARKSAAT